MTRDADELDRRFMAEALAFSRQHDGLTGTNPSVGTVIVRDDGEGPRIIGRGVTAIGGRPHAETQALAEAGEGARGATAYVTLEPCAHHGKTPPCAEKLVEAGIARVVGAAHDPDPRVSGKGYAILRTAGVEVTEGVMAEEASDQLASYLIRSIKKRPEVILKLALSADGMIGRSGAGQIAITGDRARHQVHLDRARCDGILVGIGTALADDPELTVRIPGMESRSPTRIVLDKDGRLPLTSKLVGSVKRAPVLLAVGNTLPAEKRATFTEAGVEILGAEIFEGSIALPELLEDLGQRGFMRVMVEGGAATARHFLDEGLVDRIMLYRGQVVIGEGGVAAPVRADTIPDGFILRRDQTLGPDSYLEWSRKI
ncbi:bifunctional diaminohydroxyphosphoribosylaminopyrimidine deaminase/5-amino-6-(5-phosphoribosylamino)uracil reductase RibD [Limoniibacter endophyticus]|uniref:Riboflavin biosynthesis protein RibD n=1 Tax=Limoniibacter endophyticus TaxID=1565040 RepID=A0A8J3DG66_9HYPH|nr:bifunctional diaminohydroxyphosphoribosylaminopyrimidine deaminase/5-amino-6-(5-phosphoribosylamino)uracil reductase RibD [Limoniibacter endophyticus]GHC68352.1 riboflavin biosynthesis protein RibD [Limoniibacter endophyticus]